MIHTYVNLHLDLIAGVLISSMIGYAFGWLRGKSRRR